MSRVRTKKAVLVVNSNIAVLVLMRGILQNDYRVLSAADAESAVRFLMAGRVRVDLAVIDRNVRSSRGLQRRIKAIFPELQILSMAGFVQDGVIRLQALAASNEHLSGTLVQEIRAALAADDSERNLMTAHILSPALFTPEATCTMPKVMVAGHIQ
jgi:hypothetical protein